MRLRKPLFGKCFDFRHVTDCLCSGAPSTWQAHVLSPPGLQGRPQSKAQRGSLASSSLDSELGSLSSAGLYHLRLGKALHTYLSCVKVLTFPDEESESWSALLIVQSHGLLDSWSGKAPLAFRYLVSSLTQRKRHFPRALCPLITESQLENVRQWGVHDFFLATPFTAVTNCCPALPYNRRESDFLLHPLATFQNPQNTIRAFCVPGESHSPRGSSYPTRPFSSPCLSFPEG